jgi:hypothetical protein
MSKRLAYSTAFILALSLSPGWANTIPPHTFGGEGKGLPLQGLKANFWQTDPQEPPSRDLSLADTPRPETAFPLEDNRSGPEPLSWRQPGTPQPDLAGPLPSEFLLAPGPDNWFTPGILSELVLSRARGYLHTPYRWGSSLRTGRSTDCSGFVQHVYKTFNIVLPRSSTEQAQQGRAVAHILDFAKLKPGDLLFFKRGRRHIGHVGIYLGEGKMIHASSWNRGVTISDLLQSYFRQTFVMAKRVL